MDVNELIKGSVPSITAQLSSLTAEDLGALLALEGAASPPRTSLMAAIKTEQAARAGDETSRAENDALIAANAEIETLRASVETLNDQIADLTARNAALTAATSETDRLKAVILSLEGKIAEGAQVVVQTDNRAVALVVGGDISTLRRVVFADEHDDLLWQIPSLQFDASSFKDGHDGTVTLEQAISFPRSGPANDVHSVWLVGDADENGSTGAVCRLVMPVGTGGGRAVELPKGHLRFSTES